MSLESFVPPIRVFAKVEPVKKDIPYCLKVIDEALASSPDTAFSETLGRVINHSKDVHHRKKAYQSGLNVDEAKQVIDIVLFPDNILQQKMREGRFNLIEWMGTARSLAYFTRACIGYGMHKAGILDLPSRNIEKMLIFEATILPHLSDLRKMFQEAYKTDDHEVADGLEEKEDD
ncbi:hypothetical protein JX265_014045 [Neoarthrinium moseri]|uniref:Uncharacterized protein n=1 Tax=Neoarthrinium moseri TaxID=1658444 RepID=A0A9Q0AFE5_9PEZI|nr:hypothetical protein JX265_014045 [Neoarthrinium moseri]